MRNVWSEIKKHIPKPSLLILCFFVLSLIVYAVSLLSRSFADAVNSSVSHLFRRILSLATELFPFSVFELLLWLFLPIGSLLIVIAVRSSRTSASRIRAIVVLASVLSLVATSYIYTLGIGYRTTELSDKMGLDVTTEISPDQLYKVALKVREEVNDTSQLISYSEGEARMEYSMTELSKRINSSFSRLVCEYRICKDYPTRAKPVLASGVMSSAGITGIYSFFTGECNINMSYPDYNLPFTVAHEFAHARGICRENEANFVAFLVCIYSDDPFIRYSGYLNLYGYLSNALYRADESLYRELFDGLCEPAYSDMLRASEISHSYGDSLLGRVSDKLNDFYLKSNGTDGVVSYGYVVRLAVSYYSEIE